MPRDQVDAGEEGARHRHADQHDIRIRLHVRFGGHELSLAEHHLAQGTSSAPGANPPPQSDVELVLERLARVEAEEAVDRADRPPPTRASARW